MYQAILFHPDGDYVTDFKRNSVLEVQHEISEMGSRWFFYPIAFVGTDKTIVDAPEGLEWMKRRRIKTIQNFFSSTWPNKKDEICEVINNGLPLFLVY